MAPKIKEAALAVGLLAVLLVVLLAALPLAYITPNAYLRLVSDRMTYGPGGEFIQCFKVEGADENDELEYCRKMYREYNDGEFREEIKGKIVDRRVNGRSVDKCEWNFYTGARLQSYYGVDGSFEGEPAIDCEKYFGKYFFDRMRKIALCAPQAAPREPGCKGLEKAFDQVQPNYKWHAEYVRAVRG